MRLAVGHGVAGHHLVEESGRQRGQHRVDEARVGHRHQREGYAGRLELVEQLAGPGRNGTGDLDLATYVVEQHVDDPLGGQVDAPCSRM